MHTVIRSGKWFFIDTKGCNSIVCISMISCNLLLRYSRRWVSEYKENLNRFFAQLKAILPKESLVLWNVTMPLGKKIIGGFLVPEVGPLVRDVLKLEFISSLMQPKYHKSLSASYQSGEPFNSLFFALQL